MLERNPISGLRVGNSKQEKREREREGGKRDNERHVKMASGVNSEGRSTRAGTKSERHCVCGRGGPERQECHCSRSKARALGWFGASNLQQNKRFRRFRFLPTQLGPDLVRVEESFFFVLNNTPQFFR